MSLCPHIHHACHCQPQEGRMCPYGPQPPYKNDEDQQMTNEVTLLPCPFCGRSDATRYGRSSEFHEDCDGDSGNDDYFAVFCDASEPRGLGGCGASSGFAKTCEEAALRWNRRPAVEPPAEPDVLQTFWREIVKVWDAQGIASDRVGIDVTIGLPLIEAARTVVNRSGD